MSSTSETDRVRRRPAALVIRSVAVKQAGSPGLLDVLAETAYHSTKFLIGLQSPDILQLRIEARLPDRLTLKTTDCTGTDDDIEGRDRIRRCSDRNRIIDAAYSAVGIALGLREMPGPCAKA